MREIGVGPNDRLNADAFAVSEGLIGRRDGSAVLMRDGETSAGSGGTMNKSLVDREGFCLESVISFLPGSEPGYASSPTLISGESGRRSFGFGSGNFASRDSDFTGSRSEVFSVCFRNASMRSSRIFESVNRFDLSLQFR